MQKTKSIKKADLQLNWYVIDAKEMNLGRLAVEASGLLMGKKKVTYAKNLFSGDNVIIINAKDVKVTPRKVTDKMYYRHSGFPGGLRALSFEGMMKKNPSAVIREAIHGMVPKTKMGAEILSHLYVYNDEKNPHEAQKPIKLERK